jgi:hypothetical protein
MGVPDRVENLMDDELRDAMEMSKEDLLARRDAGEPAEVCKSEDYSERMRRVMTESVERAESAGVVIQSEGESRLRLDVALKPPPHVTVGSGSTA